MNGNQYVEFEEQNYSRLCELFIKKYPAEWIDLVDAEMDKSFNCEPDNHAGEDR